MIDKSVMIITGTRKGIGKYLAEYFAEKGFFVIGCSRSDIDFKLNNYQHYSLDISDESLVNKMFTMIRKKYGRLDVLINNAGVNYALSPLLLVPYESALKTVEVNLLGTFLLSREAAKIMKKKSFGRIVNLGSMAVKHEVKGEAIYTASKAAIVSFSRVIAKEIYRAKEVTFSAQAKKKLNEISDHGFNHFPVCMAKTQYSFSIDPSKNRIP